MDWRNRIGLYGSYFLGMAGIGFTLPYLPLFLGQRGMTDRTIGLVSTLAALSGLAQFPIGLWSDRLGWRKPFLVAALGALALSTVLIHRAHSELVLGFLVILFAENGICRAVVESLAGAEATALARKGQVGAALGALRLWKPIGIILVALAGSWLAERYGVGSILVPLAVAQILAALAALAIHEPGPVRHDASSDDGRPASRGGWLPRDAGLWAFVAAMVLYSRGQRAGGRLPRAVPEARPARARAAAGLCVRGQHGRLDARGLAGGPAGRPLGA
ncbi:MAG TPA: MFS transporter, partial [Isosphaeraceae bacterium]|nr:MFS transporter [Isosphaeraceae bacterium]